MKEITDINLFGTVLSSLVGENKKVRITEKTGEINEGFVIDYSRGGYEVQGEIIPAGIRVQNAKFSFRVKIENIEKIIIIDENDSMFKEEEND